MSKSQRIIFPQRFPEESPKALEVLNICKQLLQMVDFSCSRLRSSGLSFALKSVELMRKYGVHRLKNPRAAYVVGDTKASCGFDVFCAFVPQI